MKSAFYEWIDNDHNDFEDENTTILYVELTSALLLSQRIKTLTIQSSKFVRSGITITYFAIFFPKHGVG